MTDVTTEKPRRPRTLTQIIAIRVEPELYEAIFLEAVREKRTMSGLTRMVILDWLAARVRVSGRVEDGIETTARPK